MLWSLQGKLWGNVWEELWYFRLILVLGHMTEMLSMFIHNQSRHGPFRKMDVWKQPASAAGFDLSSSKHLLWSLPSAASVISSVVPACRIYPPLLSTLFLIRPINLFETGGQAEACGSGRRGILPLKSQPTLLISPLSADTCRRGAQIPPRRLLSLTCGVWIMSQFQVQVMWSGRWCWSHVSAAFSSSPSTQQGRLHVLGHQLHVKV